MVDLAEIPTAQLGDAIDDLPALAARECATTTDGLAVTAGGDGVRLELEDATASVSDGEGGLPVTRITCRYSGCRRHRAPARSTFEDSTAPGSVGWREVTAVGDRMTLTSADVPSDSTSERLTSYPEDLLESPLDVTSATLVVATGGPAGALPGTGDDGPGAADGSWLSSRATSLLGDNGLAGRRPGRPRGARPRGDARALARARQDRHGVLPHPARGLLGPLGARGRAAR